MKVNLQSQNFRIKTLANKAESLSQTLEKSLAKNKFGSRSVLNLGQAASQKAKDLKSHFTNTVKSQKPRASSAVSTKQTTAKKGQKPSSTSKTLPITPAIAESLKASGLL